MAQLSTELAEIERAILDVPQVRGVSALHALDRGEDGIVVVTRVGLSPTLRLADVVLAIADVEHKVKTTDPRVTAVFVEPDIAADAGTPTETIVIRALD
jgi:divalent metal cation (Fe/Co/Zn/Cd) transporter